MSRNRELIRRFHEAAGHPIELEATIPAVETQALRSHLHAEEAGELQKALIEGNDAAKIARELADDLVIAYGTAEAYGIDLDKAFEIVMEANLRKVPDCPDCDGGYYPVGKPLGPGRLRPCETCGSTGKAAPLRREDGKILKPEGWDPPDLQMGVTAPEEGPGGRPGASSRGRGRDRPGDGGREAYRPGLG